MTTTKLRYDQIDTAAYGALEMIGKRPTEMWLPNQGESWSPEALMDRFFRQPTG